MRSLLTNNLLKSTKNQSDFEKIEAFLGSRSKLSSQKIFQGDSGLDKFRQFMKILGNPQDRVRVIHVAGSSGKGSTVNFISQFLTKLGFRVGASISPHIYSVRERIRLDHEVISEFKFTHYFKSIYPKIVLFETTYCLKLSYFEILIALSYWIFWQQKVDFAVVEVGLGGRLDATNVCRHHSKICIINTISLDHTQILGKTLSKIATEKAGVIGYKNLVFCLKQKPYLNQIFIDIAKKNNTNLRLIDKNSRSNNKYFYKITRQITRQNGRQNYRHLDRQTTRHYLPEYQLANLALSLQVVLELCRQYKCLAKFTRLLNNLSLEDMFFEGRFEVIKKKIFPKNPLDKAISDRVLILDGAHNPQKIESFLNSLLLVYPKKKFIFVLAFKSGKDWKACIDVLFKPIYKTLTKCILVTSFQVSQDFLNAGVDQQEICSYIRKNFNSAKVSTLESFIQASTTKNLYSTLYKSQYQFLIKSFLLESDLDIVITGSFYLLANFGLIIKQ